MPKSSISLFVPPPDEIDNGARIPVVLVEGDDPIYIRVRSLRDRRVATKWNTRFAEIGTELNLAAYEGDMPPAVADKLADLVLDAFCDQLLLGVEGFAETEVSRSQAVHLVNNNPKAMEAVTAYFTPQGVEENSVRGKSASGSTSKRTSRTKKPSPRSANSKKTPAKSGPRKASPSRAKKPTSSEP